MGSRNPHEEDAASIEEHGSIPPTVNDSTEHDDGMTLHTIDTSEERDIEIYDDARQMHMSGNPPEE
jgi:hypothetical protein